MLWDKDSVTPEAQFEEPVAAVAKVLTAPADASSPMTVTLVNFSANYEFEVPASNWPSRDTDLPVEGQKCLVVFDDDGDAWVVVW
jgi:hypothetical protein